MLSSYKEVITTLNKLQSNAEYIKHAKIKNNQENNIAEMEKFLNRSGMSLDQLDTLPVIHISGTNGKGTTCSYCESILRNHGYKTGFYSSPHLLEVRERIRLNGMPISQEKFVENFWQIYNRLDKEKVEKKNGETLVYRVEPDLQLLYEGDIEGVEQVVLSPVQSLLMSEEEATSCETTPRTQSRAYDNPPKKRKRSAGKSDDLHSLIESATCTLRSLRNEPPETNRHVLFAQYIAAELDSIKDEEIVDNVKQQISSIVYKAKEQYRQKK